MKTTITYGFIFAFLVLLSVSSYKTYYERGEATKLANTYKAELDRLSHANDTLRNHIKQIEADLYVKTYELNRCKVSSKRIEGFFSSIGVK